MPLISLDQTSPLADGRQSENAMLVRRGVQRLFLELGLAVVPELPLASGRRADLVALTRTGEVWIVEIKSSIEDFRVDRKWPIYRAHCDRLFFATHPGVPADIFPEDCGFILSDGYGAEIIRDAPEHKLAGATRKAVTLRFARISAARMTLAELSGLDLPETDME
ncbi:MmcB family DNA repair protein [Phyllobacterium endophyticum]|uniref:MmcB family DNA repair protein n=1 Tax=Phyllobacterium endophyticum TaxID=1149773 RepID=UPI0011C95894|nr:MmcB family DNA repair protein [Phyllobacterium endophyticum]TXR47958.1 MmcB family DNA repair protein [Phyllobacterium endophyticum]